jgi:hypothetical protein
MPMRTILHIDRYLRVSTEGSTQSVTNRSEGISESPQTTGVTVELSQIASGVSWLESR